uniref:Uncharacterized protein n=1 Tax=Aureoumbra lagunensis TaxID=44058 RepID=A0A7S3K5E7_9STRA|mmetsp:Transcript_9506/g.13152  ORF Transcript_9506/g.13152 Transcript_9506/m.13152 type:complete len:202 (-) Transcript_9506:343-948(-)
MSGSSVKGTWELKQKPLFFCCHSGEVEPSARLIEPPKGSRMPSDPNGMAEPYPEDFLWKLTLIDVSGLVWEGSASFVVKANYSGRTMYSDAVKIDEYRDGPIELSSRYVFKDNPKTPILKVEVFNGTPGAPNSRIGQFDLDLSKYREPNRTTTTEIEIPNTKAIVRILIGCTPLQDDDDEQASCMDVPGSEPGSGSQCLIS